MLRVVFIVFLILSWWLFGDDGLGDKRGWLADLARAALHVSIKRARGKPSGLC
jgi:hypothetical protein